MKDKILMLVIGILLGAIITAVAFILVGNKGRPNMPEDGVFKGGRGDWDRNMIMQDMPIDINDNSVNM